jgi:Kef-type K+ transport system membrane component KefB
MQPVLLTGIIIITGFVFGEAAERLKLPKITGYILAGILLNPNLSSFIPKAAIAHTDLVINISLCFITFSVGGSLLLKNLRKLGKGILWITFFEAELAFFTVVTGFCLILPLLGYQSPAQGFTVFILPFSILIGCIASPTDPTPALAITHEYRSKGDVSSTMLGVAASDDALGIMNFSLAVAVAGTLVSNSAFNLYTSVFAPLLIIAGSLIIGAIFGFLLNAVVRFIDKETEGALIVLILGLLTACFGAAQAAGCDELLATMIMGIVVCNFNPKQDKIFKILQRYTEELILVLFFTISGMHLDFSVFGSSYMLIILFVLLRIVGKYAGTVLGGFLAGSSPNVKRYTASGLVPYGGIVVGLALLIKQRPGFGSFADIIISIVIGATIISEIAGSLCVKWSLKKAKEI